MKELIEMTNHDNQLNRQLQHELQASIRRSFPLLLATSMLVACSSGGSGGTAPAPTDNQTGNLLPGTSGAPESSSVGSTSSVVSPVTPPTGSLQRVGVLEIEESQLDLSVDAFAYFFSMPFEFTTEQFLQESGIAAQAEGCEVTNFNDLFIEPVESVDPFEVLDNIAALSAGEVLTLSSPAGSYGELQSVFGIGYGNSETDLVYPAPEQLTINIPGGDFPAMSVSMQRPPEVQNFQPNLYDSVSEDTTFTWTASGNPNSFIDLSLMSGMNQIDCTLLDDGSFTLPPSVINSLDQSDTAMTQLMIMDVATQALTIQEAGDAIVFAVRKLDIGSF